MEHAQVELLNYTIYRLYIYIYIFNKILLSAILIGVIILLVKYIDLSEIRPTLSLFSFFGFFWLVQALKSPAIKITTLVLPSPLPVTVTKTIMAHLNPVFEYPNV